MALRQTYLSMKKHLPDGAQTVLVMRGRGNDELAPSKELLEDFNIAKEKCASRMDDSIQVYECAWRTSNYEERFREQILSTPASMARLRQLSDESKARDIFLICYEAEDKPCHRRLLLSIAETEFGADVDYSPLQLPDEAKPPAFKRAQPRLFPDSDSK